MIRWFSKRKKDKEVIVIDNCTMCKHYAQLKTSDKVNPDKTITRGEVVVMRRYGES